MIQSRQQRVSRGFTLVEVLVALFVLSIAVLGIAGLQVTSKRTNFESVQRTTATLLAQELLERVRANADQLTVYTNAGAGRTIQLAGSDGISATNCTAAACDTATVAMFDLYEFSQSLLGVAELQGTMRPVVWLNPPYALPDQSRRPGSYRLP